jgi:hypothetical protein
MNRDDAFGQLARPRAQKATAMHMAVNTVTDNFLNSTVGISGHRNTSEVPVFTALALQ